VESTLWEAATRGWRRSCLGQALGQEGAQSLVPGKQASLCAAILSASFAPAPQDWTKLENEDAEGLVEVTYRSGSDPGTPPDVQVRRRRRRGQAAGRAATVKRRVAAACEPMRNRLTPVALPTKLPLPQVIQKQMAIVAWQPGPNSIVQVPTEVGSARGGAAVGVRGPWQRPAGRLAPLRLVGTGLRPPLALVPRRTSSARCGRASRWSAPPRARRRARPPSASCRRRRSPTRSRGRARRWR
jgi:hypothetical protein